MIRIYENLRVVSYAPCYLAAAEGLFARHGLDVEIVASPSPSETAEGLLAGRVDLSWGGPMRVMLHHDRDPDCPLVCFCKVVGAEPFVLVGRMPRPAFRFADLLGRRVGIVTEVPTPWLTLQEDLRRAGIDPAGLTRAPQRTMDENAQALGRGEVDVVQVMEPATDAALTESGGHVWHRAASRGDVVFTSFYTTRAFLAERRSECVALEASVREALTLVNERPADAVARTIGSFFPELPADRLARGIARYQAARIWPPETRLPASAYVRLKGALLSGGFIARDVPYEAAVAVL